MTASDGQDHELLERYRQASDTDPRAPSAAVRAAILEEGRRAAATVTAVSVEPRHGWRWKRTAYGTAAAALLAALVIAPRLWDQAPPPAAAVSAANVPFNQAAKKTEPPQFVGEPQPAVPVIPVPGPSAQSIAPSRIAEPPSLHRYAAPAPVHVPEQSVEITSVIRQQNAEMQNSQARRASSSRSAATDAQRSTGASTPLLAAAAAAGDLGKTSHLLDQGAAINDRDASGSTALLLAVGQDRLDIVRLLLARGADPNAADQNGRTPLQLAQQNQFAAISSLLVKAGAH